MTNDESNPKKRERGRERLEKVCFVEIFSLTPRFNAVAGAVLRPKNRLNGFSRALGPSTWLKPGVSERAFCTAHPTSNGATLDL
jgi:hypothetical protein